MIINKITKSYVERFDKPNENWATDKAAYYLVDSNSEFAAKIRENSPFCVNQKLGLHKMGISLICYAIASKISIFRAFRPSQYSFRFQPALQAVHLNQVQLQKKSASLSFIQHSTRMRQNS